jgi:hypothetical protein
MSMSINGHELARFVRDTANMTLGEFQMEFGASFEKPLTKYELQLLAEYDDCMAEIAEIESAVAAMKHVEGKIGNRNGGNVAAGIVKLASRYLDDDEAAAMLAMACSHADLQQCQLSTCGVDPGHISPQRTLRKALAKRAWATREHA